MESIDRALTVLLEKSRSELESYECKTIAEALAKKLLFEALDEPVVKAGELVINRTSGRAGQKKVGKDTDLTERLKELLS